MIDSGKQSILGILINIIDYEAAIKRVMAAGRQRESLLVSALAVHGVMTGVLDPQHRYRLNRFDILAPDGQPVRWALNLLHAAGLTDRVYGPKLTLQLFEKAADENLPVYMYGTTDEVLLGLRGRLLERFPNLTIAGHMASRFRQISEHEKLEIANEIRNSGARILFVALGCPRQEVWAHEHRRLLSLPIVAIGAAFPFIAGTLPQAPEFVQRLGLEWLFRLVREPRRLWRRYILLNGAYLCLVALQSLGKRFDAKGKPPSGNLLFG
jgi:N-acetylglucosaminyldiphosphoundecaprenol N-acetyl-beta-D-mannosaminyltransferase